LDEHDASGFESALDRSQIFGSRNPSAGLIIRDEVRWHDCGLGKLRARKGKKSSGRAALSRGRPAHQK
jgi:hypothetical protein